MDQNFTTKQRLYIDAMRVLSLMAATQLSVVQTVRGTLRYQHVLKV